MLRSPLNWLAVMLIAGIVPANMSQAASAGEAASAYQLSPNISFAYDADAERQLFDWANQVRAKAGVPALVQDDGLTQAARTHAEAMAGTQQLSHQFPGEPSLEQRLAATSTLHLDRAGENVSFSTSVNQAQDALMKSPPHRENLLNPAYNVAGFGVIRREAVLYIVQDFAHHLPTASAERADTLVVQGVSSMRHSAHLPQLQRADGRDAQMAACSMARADSLAGSAPQGHYTLRYTTMQPETVPASAAKAVDDRVVRQLAVGTCYARTASYPNGVYWVILVLN